ncbi:Ribosomal protein L7/L12 [Rickettsiales bacterium Ac37b]|nr:Ribosomal protein L7/L12 [Rickettsiales bacterium Ac37b]
MAELSKIVDDIASLSLIEASELSKMLEEKLGVSAMAPVATVAAAAPVESSAAQQTEFTVILKSAGSDKIKVIKEVRVILPGLNLKEAKELVETPGKSIKESISKEEAEKIAKQLKDAGAEVEIK